jgi:hypothetical protein
MMTDSTTAVYAIIDRSKKRRKNSTSENAESSLPSFDSPVYDAAEITPVAATPLPGKSEDAINSEYSTITLDNMYSTVSKTKQNRESETTPRQTTVTEGDKKKRRRARGSGSKIFACIFIIIAIITLICLAILFDEVSKLRNQQHNLLQVSNLNSSIMLHLKEIATNLSMAKELKFLILTINCRL